MSPFYRGTILTQHVHQLIRAIQPAGLTRRPPTGCTRQTSDRRKTDRQTDVRQHHRLMPHGPGHNKFAAVFGDPVYIIAHVFVNVADDLISKVSALETKVATLEAGSGKSLTLYM